MGKGGVQAPAYTFASEPRPRQQSRVRWRMCCHAERQRRGKVSNRAVLNARASFIRVQAKYREDEEARSMNIMSDPRVVRGNTYAAQVLPASLAQEKEEMAAHEGEASRKKSTATKARSTKRMASVTSRSRDRAREEGEPPVEGRRHTDVQTDEYLEELTDGVEEVDRNTQTDLFMDRPPEPEFVPMKVGLDAETQIWEGELFDFDMEVEPILETLVGKVLEQGTMEVQEEEELAALRAHQEHFEQVRSAELAAAQRMEAAEKRKQEEKERRLAQERERLDREATLRKKVAASTFARGLLHGMARTAFSSLRDGGHFHDPVRNEIATNFLPSLFNDASLDVESHRAAVEAVRKMAQAAHKLHLDSRQFAESSAQRAKEVEERRAEERESARRQQEEEEKASLEEESRYIIEHSHAVSAEEVQRARDEVAKATQEQLLEEHEERVRPIRERNEQIRQRNEEREQRRQAAQVGGAGGGELEEEKEKQDEEEGEQEEEQGGVKEEEEEQEVEEDEEEEEEPEPPETPEPTARQVLEKLLEQASISHEAIARAIAEKDTYPS